MDDVLTKEGDGKFSVSDWIVVSRYESRMLVYFLLLSVFSLDEIKNHNL